MVIACKKSVNTFSGIMTNISMLLLLRVEVHLSWKVEATY
jgi:hypothetical protein